MSSGEPAVVVQKAYDWALWVILKAEKFPKSYRFTLGETLVRSLIELLLHLVDATYQARNAGSLGAAVREVNRIRYLVRLAKDLHVINIDGHEFAAKTMDEIGRMTGGWLKSARQGREQRRETGWQSLEWASSGDWCIPDVQWQSGVSLSSPIKRLVGIGRTPCGCRSGSSGPGNVRRVFGWVERNRRPHSL